MEQITQSTSYTYVFLLVDETDDETAETGKAPTVQISKNGGAFASATNAASEIGSGWYKVVLTTTETNTLGALAIIAYATGTNVFRSKVQVVAATGAVSVSLTTAQYNQIADHVLRRLTSNVEASSDGDAVAQHSLLGAVLQIAGRTRVNSPTGELVVYKTDETTEFYRQTLTSDASADPIVEKA